MGAARDTFSEIETRFMQRAIELARRARGQTAPNPMVGCVLVKDDAIIAEGWHTGPGKDHAEAAALKAADGNAGGATAYVTLEPCNHTGRTGPCSEALIAAGITRVVFAVADPNPLAAGGAGRLREAGIEVTSGLCEHEARYLIRAWLHTMETRRPYVTGKTAMSLDGRIATASGESQWITSKASRDFGHSLRMEADAIIVGANTVVADNPRLTARSATHTQHPLRVVLDSTARTSSDAQVYDQGERATVLATTASAPAERMAAFSDPGVEIIVLPANDNGRPDLPALLSALFERGIHHILLEGGGEVLGAFFDANLIDELHLFIAPMLIGGGKAALGGCGVATLADSGRFALTRMEDTGPDQHWRATRCTKEAA